MTRGSLFLACLPGLACLGVVAVMLVAARLVGFFHPEIMLEVGSFMGSLPSTSEEVATDLRGRLRWSITHASWWVIQVSVAICLIRMLWRDTSVAGEPGMRLRVLYLVGAAATVIAMLLAGWGGVQFAGPLVAALQSVPVGPGGEVLAGTAVLVNAGASTIVFMVALGFSALVLRVETSAPSDVVEAFDQLLWLGAVSLAITTLEVSLGLRWAASLTAFVESERVLPDAVASAQAWVIGAVGSLSLGAIAFTAYALIHDRAGGSTARQASRALGVLAPVLVAIGSTAA